MNGIGRFARSVSQLLRALETFKALRIEFVSLSEQVDTSTPTGKMVFTVGVEVGGLRAKFPDIENKALRDWIVKEVKSAIPVRRGRKYNPIISRALQLRIHGKMWREILRDPEVLGPKPTEPRQRYMWETTARSIRKAAALRTSRSKRKVCKQQINRTIPWVQSDPN